MKSDYVTLYTENTASKSNAINNHNSNDAYQNLMKLRSAVDVTDVSERSSPRDITA